MNAAFVAARSGSGVRCGRFQPLGFPSLRIRSAARDGPSLPPPPAPPPPGILRQDPRCGRPNPRGGPGRPARGSGALGRGRDAMRSRAGDDVLGADPARGPRGPPQARHAAAEGSGWRPGDGSRRPPPMQVPPEHGRAPRRASGAGVARARRGHCPVMASKGPSAFGGVSPRGPGPLSQNRVARRHATPMRGIKTRASSPCRLSLRMRSTAEPRSAGARRRGLQHTDADGEAVAATDRPPPDRCGRAAA